MGDDVCFVKNENKVTHEAPRLLKIIQTWLLDGHSACIRGNFAQIAIKKKKKIKSFPTQMEKRLVKTSGTWGNFHPRWVSFTRSGLCNIVNPCNLCRYAGWKPLFVIAGWQIPAGAWTEEKFAHITATHSRYALLSVTKEQNKTDGQKLSIKQ